MTDEQQHALEIIAAKKKRLRVLEVQQAQQGHNTLPHIVVEIEELRDELPKLQREADRAVSGMGVPNNLLGGANAASPLPASPQQVPAHVDSLPTHLLFRPVQAALAPGPAPILDPPPLPPLSSRRDKTVASILSATGRATWLAINGSSSTGKTILMRLITGRGEGRVVWVRFKGLDDESAAALLDTVSASLAGELPPPQRAGWYRKVCSNVSVGGTLALDDLPDLTGFHLLRERLQPLILACSEAEGRVVSTSLHPVPPSLREEADGLLVEYAAPPLTEEEASEILLAYGASAAFSQENARLINDVARRHPFLLVAASRYLQGRGWVLDDGEFTRLLAGAHAADLAGEVYQKLCTTVPDGNTRQLLYRLTLADQPFGRVHLEALAEVQDRIDRAAERLRDVTHSWVEQRGDGRWRPSPLLERLAAEHLDADTRRRCHSALGALIMRSGAINQTAAFNAVHHFFQAGELDQAGTVLTLVLHAALREKVSLEGDPLLKLWTGQPLPQDMNLRIRLPIRGLQIAILHRLNKPLTFLIQDFESLLGEAKAEHRVGAVMAVVRAVLEVARALPAESNRWVRRLLQLPKPPQRRNSRSPKGRAAQEGADSPTDMPMPLLIWQLVVGIKTTEDIKDWLDTLACMDRQGRAETFQAVQAQVGAIFIADQPISTEVAKPPEQRDWPGLATALGVLAHRAKELGIEGLWASLVRSRIIVQAEFCKDIEGAIAVATAALNIATHDPAARFLITGAIGRQLVLARCYPDARFWLGLALRADSDKVYGYERSLVLLAASHAFGVEDKQAGVEHARRAAELADRDASIPPIERARAYSELAVAEFEASGAPGAFKSWDRAGEYLFAARDNSPAWKDLAVVFGHTSGYLARLAETGEAPTATRDGDPYTPPSRGVFMTSNPARIGYYDARNEGALWRVLGYYADSVEARERAAAWRARAVETGHGHGVLSILLGVGGDEIPRLLREGDFAAVLAAARQTGAGLVVLKREQQAGREPTRADLDIAAALKELPESDRKQAEDFGATIGFIPAVLFIATHAAEDGTNARSESEARKLVAASRDVAATSGDPELWTLLADTLERAFVEGWDYEAMRRWSESFPQPAKASLDVLGRLAWSVNATPEQAVASLLAVMPALCGWYPVTTPIAREILLPFVETYWTKMFERSRFLFGNAVAVEHQLPAALAAPEKDRIQAIFRAIHAGFRFVGEMPPPVRTWLWG